MRSYWLNHSVIPAYKQVLEPYQELAYNEPLYFSQMDKALIGSVFNRAVYLPELRPLPEDQILNPQLDFQAIEVSRWGWGPLPAHGQGRALASARELTSSFCCLDVRLVQAQYFAQEPGFVVVDDLLTPEALAMVQETLIDSTFWFESKPLLPVGYVGAYMDDGLHQPVSLDLGLMPARPYGGATVLDDLRLCRCL